MDFEFTALPPQEAVEFFRRKGFQVGFDWRDVWQDEHARAFTVAKAMTLDLLQDLRNVVDKAIAEGIAFEDFRDNLEPVLRARGWWGRAEMTDLLTGETRNVQLGSNRRLRIIYDTNLRTSWSAGSWQQVQRTKALLPFLRYVDPDPHPRPEHLDWSGTILRSDDPWWATHYPPNGWNCKCEANSYGEKDLHERGWQEMAAPPPSPTYSYVNPRTGAVSEIPVGIDPGFAHNPGIAGIRYAAEQALKEKLATADTDIARAVEKIREPEPVLPESFKVRGRASVKFRQAAQDAYESIPEHLRKRVEAAGHTVTLGRTVVEIAPRLKGEHPRGWPAKATFEEVPAAFLPSEGTIAIGEYVRRGMRLVTQAPEDVAARMRHEFGHSLDVALDRISDGPEFARAYHQDAAAITAADRAKLNYFLQAGEAGRHKTFSQLLAEALGGAPGGRRISGLFPACWNIVRSLVEGRE